MNRPFVPVGILAAVVCAGPWTVWGGTPASRPPNIVLILTDDQGFGDMSCHGNPILRTPYIDRLHDEGVRFSDFHVSPTCSPTRSALMTGRHEFRNGVTHTILERERLSLEATTLAQVLQLAGYTTGIFGKWHLGDEDPYQPGRRGFDEVFIHGGGGIGQTFPGSCGDAPGNSYFDPAILHNGTFEKTRGYCTDVFFGEALKWIETVKGRQPFFAYIATNAPHAPLQVRPEDGLRYAGRVPEDVANFYGMIANIDDHIGRLLAKLEEWGIDRDTLVVFMNDNGTATGSRVFNAGMRGAKGSPWLGGTRAASFWRWPGTLRPADVDRLAAHVDFLPTVAEIAGIHLADKVRRQVEGRSLWTLLKDPNAPWPDRLLVTHVGRWEKGKASESKYLPCSVRNARWHLVCASAPGEKHWQLYDVMADPGEGNDVVLQHPDVVREMEAAYDAWWDSVQPYLVNENAVAPLVNPFKDRFGKQFGAGSASKPNFVFILADDLGWRDLGCYGSPFYETPHLDRLAARGMRFTQAYAACNVCSPTRASLLTGKHPARLHLTDWLPGRPDRPDQRLLRPTLIQQLPLEEVTVAEALRQGGYRTAFIGKWHLGGTGFHPQDQGFDLNVGGCHMGHPPSYYSPYGIPTLPDGPTGEYLTDRLTDEAIRFIEEAKGRPFFLYLSHYAVHTPLQAKPDLIAKYKAKAAGLPAPGVPEFLSDNGRRVRQIQGHAVYASMIEGLDDSVGRLMERLAELGLDRNTVVVFTSDNGGLSTAEGTPTSNVPLRMGKGWNYEGGIREPLLVRWPGVTRPGSTCDEPVISMDYYPTFLEMADLPLRPGQHMDGVSLVPALRGSTRPERPLFWHYPHYSNQGGSPSGAVRIGDFKLIESFEDMQARLFNLRDDLGERNDLASQMPEKVASLSRQLHDWRRSVDARMPSPNPDYRPDTGRASNGQKGLTTMQGVRNLEE